MRIFPIAVIGVTLLALTGAAETYCGIRPTDPDGRDGLANPERGWRFEIGVGRLPEDPVKFTHIRDQWPFPRFVRDGVTVSQAYCYLSQFHDRPVSDEKIAALERDFARARKDGVKFLLRFAYESDGVKEGPTTERILAHIEQLKPIVRRNIDVIYCLQMGWIGLWGEFHTSAHRIEKDPAAVARIVRATLDMLPPERMTMMRRIVYKERVLETLGAVGEATAESSGTDAPAARIGFFNDGTLANWGDGGTFTEKPYADNGNPEFERVKREGLYTPVDGELFWTGVYGSPLFANGYRAIGRLSSQHYTTLSLVHSHSLLDRSDRPWTIDGWKVTPVTAEALKFFGIDFDPAWFEGVPYRTAYEFIRDHLGYRIAVKEAEFPKEFGSDARVRVTLHNYGFAPPVNPREVFVVLLSADGKTCIECPTGFNCRGLMPGKDAEVVCTLDDRAADFSGEVALWLPDGTKSLRYDSRYAIRLATRLPVKIVGGRLLNVIKP